MYVYRTMAELSGYKVFQASEIEWILDPILYEEDDSGSLTQLIDSDHIITETTTETTTNNDETSETQTKIPIHEGVAVYQHTQYKGQVVYLYEEGDYSLHQFKDMGLKNDDISSIHISPGWSIQLFEHHNFEGENIIFTSDESNLIEHKWNDRASSLKIRKGKITAPKSIEPSQWSKIYQQKKDAVLSLLCEKSDGWYVGSAFFISHDGYIVTAAHNIIENSANDRPKVILGTVSNINDTGATQAIVCDVIGVDGNGDVAVLKARGIYNQTYFHWGRSRNTSIGSDICTFGDPKGQDFQSFSAGHVRDNRYVYKGTIESIAIDAQIYEGCSGSPILDVHGQVVGIVCFGVQNGDGFSWGMSQYTLEYVVHVIIHNHTNYVKGVFDFEWRPVDAFFLHRTGMLHRDVSGIYCLTNSASSELQKYDIIVSIDGISVHENNAASILWRKQPNDVVKIAYIRPTTDDIRTAHCTLKSYSPQEDVVQLGFVQATKYLIQPQKLEMENV